jgi:hypothetical protein
VSWHPFDLPEVALTKMSTPAKSYSCFVHSPCSDGILSAAVVMFANPNNKWYPLEHPVPLFTEAMCREDNRIRGQHVLFMDIAPKSIDCLRAIAKYAASVLVLDHHQTTADTFAPLQRASAAADRDTEEDMVTEPLADVVRVSSMQSGAGLAWSHFFSITPPPSLVEYVQDRDLHQDKLKWSREITAVYYDLPLDAVEPHLCELKCGQLSDSELEQYANRGRELLAHRSQMARGAVDKATFRRETIGNVSYLVGYVATSEYLRGHAANAIFTELFARVPTLDIGALTTYQPRPHNQTLFSLRAGPLCPKLSVAAIAKTLVEQDKVAKSGGGHAFAAGVQRVGHQQTLTIFDLQLTDIVMGHAAGETKETVVETVLDNFSSTDPSVAHCKKCSSSRGAVAELLASTDSLSSRSRLEEVKVTSAPAAAAAAAEAASAGDAASTFKPSDAIAESGVIAESAVTTSVTFSASSSNHSNSRKRKRVLFECDDFEFADGDNDDDGDASMTKAERKVTADRVAESCSVSRASSSSQAKRIRLTNVAQDIALTLDLRPVKFFDVVLDTRTGNAVRRG